MRNTCFLGKACVNIPGPAKAYRCNHDVGSCGVLLPKSVIFGLKVIPNIENQTMSSPQGFSPITVIIDHLN
jgi:hypothetical protein